MGGSTPPDSVASCALDGPAVEVISLHRFVNAAVGPDGTFYVAGSHGLEVLRGNRLEPLVTGPRESMQSVLAARDGSLWCTKRSAN